MHILRMIAFALVITGALVWGVVGFFGYNIIGAMFGDMSLVSRIIYSLVGLSAIAVLAIPQEEECYCDCTDTTHRY